MFLRKIIAQGFKSFADRVTLTLDQRNITGIVGPNGSGKSNVIDAVRWVMGEQNAKMLRGEVSTDIIFSGSEKRKPLAMAEVTLVFDNRNYSAFCPPEYRGEDEISLTRRLYIDGQREYMINRRPARLKDLAGFFAATGLGGRSYSMIQQGQVDRILQAKPEQLREILEEAAGVQVYKQRRAEADRKLQDTDQNLERIEDLLGELSSQMETLEKQAEAARRYKDLTTLIRDTDMELMGQNYKLFSAKQDSIAAEKEELLLKEVAVGQQITEYESKHSAIKAELEATDPELNKINESITVLRENVASTEAQLNSKRSVLLSTQESLTSLKEELDGMRHSFIEQEQQMHQAKEQFELAAEEAETLEGQIEFFAEERETTGEQSLILEQRYEDQRIEISECEKRRDIKRAERAALEKEFSETKRMMNEHTEVVTELEQSISENQILLDGMRVKERNQQSSLEQQTASQQRFEVEYSQLQTKLQKLAALKAEKRETLLASKTKLELLSSFEEQHENDLRSFCQQLPTDLDGKVCYLIDHLSLNSSSSDLSPAALRTIEDWLERLAISDSAIINSLTAELSNQQMSGIKATLADEHSPVGLNWARQHQLSKLASVLDIINVTENPLLAKIIEQAIDGVFIAKGELDLNLLEKDTHTPSLIIFSDGSTLEANSKQLTLGQLSDTHGSLTRKQEIATLSTQASSLEAELQQTEQSIHKMESTADDLNTKLESTRSQAKRIQESIYELRAEIRSTEQASEYRRTELSKLNKQFSDQSVSYEQYASRLESLIHELKGLDEQISNGRHSLEEVKVDLEDCRVRQEEANTQWEERRLDLQSIKTRAETLREHLERDQVSHAERDKVLEAKKQQIEKAESSASQGESEVESLSVLLRDYLEARSECEDKLSQIKANSSETLAKLRDSELKIAEAKKIAFECKSKASELTIESERASIALANIASQAMEKYSLEIAKLSIEIISGYDPSTKAKKVTQYKKELLSLGDVNLTAIEAYEELSKRHQFIDEQKNEVLKAKEKLQEAIHEIEESTKDKFLEMFTTLNVEFSNLFPILFPRGEGSLHLNDQQNPLNAGVEIYVRLPGKKRQNMRLFSGGEKALTAIALIFALLKSKPTPFCFLDEVDAPLDETNVKRYNNVLEALADRFQFIVITHRRRTMEVLDTLYGVTMQEPGVSKVVGVDMNRALPAHLQKSFKEAKPQASTQIN